MIFWLSHSKSTLPPSQTHQSWNICWRNYLPANGAVRCFEMDGKCETGCSGVLEFIWRGLQMSHVGWKWKLPSCCIRTCQLQCAQLPDLTCVKPSKTWTKDRSVCSRIIGSNNHVCCAISSQSTESMGMNMWTHDAVCCRDCAGTVLRWCSATSSPRLNLCSGNLVACSVSSACGVLESSHGVQIVAPIFTMHLRKRGTDVAVLGCADSAASWMV